jgi:hypothetical protein
MHGVHGHGIDLSSFFHLMHPWAHMLPQFYSDQCHETKILIEENMDPCLLVSGTSLLVWQPIMILFETYWHRFFIYRPGSGVSLNNFYILGLNRLEKSINL